MARTAGRTVIEGAYIATVDGLTADGATGSPAGNATTAIGTEYPDGHLVLQGNRILAVGAGPAPQIHRDGATLIDGRGCLLTPGLINTHHHLYQWITRGLALDDTLFGWLSVLYPFWAQLDAEAVHAAAAANLGWLALSGCSTTTDHHYVFPADAGDLLAAEIEAAQQIGIRFIPCRGSMNLGQSAGGLPPDTVVQGHDEILASTEQAIDRWHDPSPDAMLQIAVAPCSPFSVTTELMRDSAALARTKGVRLHTHLAETVDEEEFCQETYGRTPAEYAEDLGWLGPDVWLAHCVHLNDAAIGRFASTGTGVAHCPTSNGRLGAGAARTRDLLAAGVPVGLGVDGAASNESGRLIDELRQATLVARTKDGPLALAVRQALYLATAGGASVLGRGADLGRLRPGALADLALWRLDDLAAAGIADPIGALVFGSPTLRALWIDGRVVVADGELGTADVRSLAAGAARASAAVRSAFA